PQVRALARQIGQMRGVSAVAPAQPAGPDNSLLAVAPVQGPLSGATQQLVRDVRSIHTPMYVGVTGQTAGYLDLEHSLGAHLPAVLAHRIPMRSRSVSSGPGGSSPPRRC